VSTATETRAPDAPRPKSLVKRRRTQRRATALQSHGEPFVWLTGGAMAVALAMIVGLLVLVVNQGALTFWPHPLVRIERVSGTPILGEVTVDETFQPGPDVFERLPPDRAATVRDAIAARGGTERRRMLRTGNFDLVGSHYTWVSDFEVKSESHPEWALVVERMAWGRFQGEPAAFKIGGETVATGPRDSWARYVENHDACRVRADEIRDLQTDDIGAVNAEMEDERLALRKVELQHGKTSPEYAAQAARSAQRQTELEQRFQAITDHVHDLTQENARYELVLTTADGTASTMQVSDIVRAFPANQLGFGGKLRVYLSRWKEFLTDRPREANSEGGVFPAIFGTVVMTLLMSILVVPFGVLAALYLREYARQGFLVSLVRIAVNNLAGVPSIVFGVFGLGFFCYIVGASIDQLLFAEKLPNPTYGKGGLIWAAFTLALLTLPVVIVATEEALSAVPGSMREGSYACGATKWQTIRRIVLPRALPGIMTGMILAIARGAGEVAPLMLVGAVKLAPNLPVDVDGSLPFVHLHPERSFMHLGFHIFDLGFQSQNSEAAKPMVYTTTLLLIGIIVVLNLSAIWVRGRLRRRFAGGQF
jgi:phosphate transport system permease protein